MSAKELYKEYEEQLLGRIIYNKDIFFENAGVIDEQLFYEHRDIYDVFSSLIAEGKHPGIYRILTKCQNKKAVIQKMVKKIDHEIPLDDIIQELQEAKKLRHIESYMMEAATYGTSDEKIIALTKAVTEVTKSEQSQFESAYDAVKNAINELDYNTKNGVPTGYKGFDELTGGLQGTDLVILAAQPSVGKTALSLNIAENAVSDGHPACIVSLEMSNSQIMTRMVVARSGIPKKYLKENLSYVTNVASQYKDQELYIADVSDNRVTHVLGLIRGAYMRHGIKVAIVDYLQLVQGVDSKQSREQEVGQIARSLKNLAKELNICIIALSQLRRPKMDSDPFPTMSRLRDSGQIEEAADIVWFIYRPEYHGITEDENGNSTEGKALMIIAKGRNYGTTAFETKFEGHIAKFVDRDVGTHNAVNTELQGDPEERPPF